MHDVSKAATVMFGTLGGTMAINAAAAATAAIVGLTNEAIKNAEAMGVMAQKAGMPVAPFSQLVRVAELAEVSQQDLIAASKNLSKELEAQGRASVGVLPEMLRLADVFKTMPDGVEKTNLAVEKFGKSGQNLIPLLNQGSEAIRRQMQVADELGLTISSEFAGNADLFGDNVQLLRQAMQGLWLQVAEQVLPTLIQLSLETLEWVKAGNKMAATARTIGDAFKDLTNTAKGSNIFSWLQLLSPMTAGGAAATLLANKQRNDLADADKGFDRPDARITVVPAQATIDSSKKFRDSIGEMIDLERQFRLEQLTGYEQQKERLAIEFQTRVDSISQIAIHDSEFIAMSLEAYEAYYFKLSELSKKEADEEKRRRKELNDVMVSQSSAAFGNMAHAMKAFGKEGLAAWKAFATAQAIMDTYKAANAAYAALAGIPVVGPALGAAAAAAAIAAGLANVAMIQSTKVSGQAHAGLDMVPSTGTYILERGEKVVKANQGARLDAFLDRAERGGSAGPTHIHLHVAGHEIANWIYDGTRTGEILVHPRAVRTP